MLTTRLPVLVEPYRLAANAEHLEGTVPLCNLARLREEAGTQQGDGQVRLDFGVDVQGRRFIEGQLEAQVSLACRRCLEPMSVRVESHFLLGLVANDALSVDLPAAYEPVIVENEQLDLHAMLEDELILSLPQVVYHDEEKCLVSPDQLSSGAEVATSAEPAKNPFDVLRTLKKKQ